MFELPVHRSRRWRLRLRIINSRSFSATSFCLRSFFKWRDVDTHVNLVFPLSQSFSPADCIELIEHRISAAFRFSVTAFQFFLFFLFVNFSQKCGSIGVD